MSRLDNALREALRRQAPPAGFADRVLARLGESPVKASRWEALFEACRLPRFRWAGVAVASLTLIAGLEYHRQRQVRLQGELAKEQAVLALQIAADKLQVTQQKVYRAISVR